MLIPNAVITSWKVPSGATGDDSSSGIVLGGNLLLGSGGAADRTLPCLVRDPSERRIADLRRAGVELVRLLRFRYAWMRGAGLTGVADGVQLVFSRLDNGGKIIASSTETLKVVAVAQKNCHAFGYTGGGNVIELGLGR